MVEAPEIQINSRPLNTTRRIHTVIVSWEDVTRAKYR